MTSKTGICVDASCRGNPGPTEYQGVHRYSGEVLFRISVGLGTNNIGEFLAIVHALAHLKKENMNASIFSDSQTAINWVKERGFCSTGLKRSSQSVRTFNLIERANKWISANKELVKSAEIIKWDTDKYGEIPADFGRKTKFDWNKWKKGGRDGKTPQG